MDARHLETLRQQLQRELEKLLVAAGGAVAQLVDPRDTHADSVDTASEEADRDLTLFVQEHDRRKIMQIRHALQRIRDGEYGDCDACGEEIGIPRLCAQPTATLCIDCATDRELRAS